MTPDDQKRLAELHRETLADWTRRFFRESGMPEPDNAEKQKSLFDWDTAP